MALYKLLFIYFLVGAVSQIVKRYRAISLDEEYVKRYRTISPDEEYDNCIRWKKDVAYCRESIYATKPPMPFETTKSPQERYDDCIKMYKKLNSEAKPENIIPPENYTEVCEGDKHMYDCGVHCLDYTPTNCAYFWEFQECIDNDTHCSEEEKIEKKEEYVRNVSVALGNVTASTGNLSTVPCGDRPGCTFNCGKSEKCSKDGYKYLSCVEKKNCTLEAERMQKVLEKCNVTTTSEPSINTTESITTESNAMTSGIGLLFLLLANAWIALLTKIL